MGDLFTFRPRPVEIMAQISSAVIRRLPFSAKAAAQLSVYIEKSSSSVRSEHGGLCQSFRKLALSPQEAQLSAALLKVASHHTGPGIVKYELPSLIKPLKITVPSLYNGKVLDKNLPPLTVDEKVDPSDLENKEIRDAPSEQVIEKQAARLIVIRRRMMNKHKLKKLRKKMRFEWLKIIQRREYRKEKEFQATQMGRIRFAEAFNAESFVADMLRQTKETPDPKFYKGKRLPKEIIYELMEKDKQKKVKNEQAKKEKLMRWQDI